MEHVTTKASNKLLTAMCKLWLAAGKHKGALKLAAAAIITVGMSACLMLALGNTKDVHAAARAIRSVAHDDPDSWTKALVVNRVCDATRWSRDHMRKMITIANSLLPNLQPAPSGSLQGLLSQAQLAMHSDSGLVLAPAGQRAVSFPDLLGAQAAWQHTGYLALKIASALRSMPHGKLATAMALPGQVSQNIVALHAHIAWQYVARLAPRLADASSRVIAALPKLALVPRYALAVPGSMNQHAAMVSAVMQACWRATMTQAMTLAMPVDMAISAGIVASGKLFRGLFALVTYAVQRRRGPYVPPLPVPVRAVNASWVIATLNALGGSEAKLLEQFPGILRAPCLLASLDVHRKLARDLLLAAIRHCGGLEVVRQLFPELATEALRLL